MLFSVTVLAGMVIGRKIGWGISKGLFYVGPSILIWIMLLIWGTGIAYVFHLSLIHFHPSTVFKVIGYGAASYVAIPNYGLFAESTIPSEAIPRHKQITNVPLIAFIVAAVLFAYFL